jgi:hypothetical protein
MAMFPHIRIKNKMVDTTSAEKEIVRQILEQWTTQTANGYIVKKLYPVTVYLNGNKRNLLLFKKKSNGPLYVESLDLLIYGPVFTQFKVEEQALVEVGFRQFFGRDEVVKKRVIQEFADMFSDM